MIKSYKDLDIYKEGYSLSLEIYKLTAKYPKNEIFGLTSQIRRAATSVVLNIAEGYGRQSKDDFKRFLKFSLGSNNETITLIELSKDLNYLSKEEYDKIIQKYNILGKKIYTLISNWK